LIVAKNVKGWIIFGTIKRTIVAAARLSRSGGIPGVDRHHGTRNITASVAE
jgi:hypothetical protein